MSQVEPWNSVCITLNISREGAVSLHRLAVQNGQVLRDLGVLSLSIENGQTIHLAGSKIKHSSVTPSTPGNMTILPHLSHRPDEACRRSSWSCEKSVGRQNAESRSDFAHHWHEEFPFRRSGSTFIGNDASGHLVPNYARSRHFRFPPAHSERTSLGDGGGVFHKNSDWNLHYSASTSEHVDMLHCLSSSLTSALHDRHLVTSQRPKSAHQQDDRSCVFQDYASSFGDTMTNTSGTLQHATSPSCAAFGSGRKRLRKRSASNGAVVSRLFDKQRGAYSERSETRIRTVRTDGKCHVLSDDLAVLPVDDALVSSCLWQKSVSSEYRETLSKIPYGDHEHSRITSQLSSETQRERADGERSLDAGLADTVPHSSCNVPTKFCSGSPDLSAFSPASLEEKCDSSESVYNDPLQAAPFTDVSRFAVERALTLLSENIDSGSPHTTVDNFANNPEDSSEEFDRVFDGRNFAATYRRRDMKLERNIGDSNYADNSELYEKYFYGSQGSVKAEQCGFEEQECRFMTGRKPVCIGENFRSCDGYARNNLGSYSNGDSLFFSPTILPASIGSSRFNPDMVDHPCRTGSANFSQMSTKPCTPLTAASNLPIFSKQDLLYGQTLKKSGHLRMDPSAECFRLGSSPRDGCTWSEFDLCGSVPDSGIASNTSSGGSDLSELERTLGGSLENFPRCQEMAEARSRFRSGCSADDDGEWADKRIVGSSVTQAVSSGNHAESFCRKTVPNSSLWHGNLETSTCSTPLECCKEEFGLSEGHRHQISPKLDDFFVCPQALMSENFAGGPTGNVPSGFNVSSGSESINTSQRSKAKAKVGCHSSDVSPPEPTVSSCYEPSITCPNLPHRLSESIKLVMRGVPLVGSSSEAFPPPASSANNRASAPAEDPKPSTIIRITKTKSTHHSNQKETWSIQPVIRHSQELATSGVKDTAASGSWDDVPRPTSVAAPSRPAVSVAAAPAVHAKFTSKLARKVVIDVENSLKRRKLDADSLPFGAMRRRLWQKNGTRGLRQSSSFGCQMSCEKDDRAVGHVEAARPFCCARGGGDYNAEGRRVTGTGARTREDVWCTDVDVGSSRHSSSHGKFP